MERRDKIGNDSEMATREVGIEMVGWKAETEEVTAKSDSKIDEWNFIIYSER
jgi:hypothetical protein